MQGSTPVKTGTLAERMYTVCVPQFSISVTQRADQPDSQADSASSILVTRSKEESLGQDYDPDLGFSISR
jgi:hypothetical protein